MYLDKKDRVDIIDNALSYIVVFAMLAYGVGKAVQFKDAQHITSKVSDLTGMQLLWAFYGYSYTFVLTLGVLEVLGGIFVSTILSNIILQDIYYGVNFGALKAAIIYQLCIFIIFWINIKKLKAALVILANHISFPQTKSKWAIKIGFSLCLLIVLKIVEYFITIIN